MTTENLQTLRTTAANLEAKLNAIPLTDGDAATKAQAWADCNRKWRDACDDVRSAERALAKAS